MLNWLTETEREIERQQWLHRTLCLRQFNKGNLTMSFFFKYIPDLYFEEIWAYLAMSHQAPLICYSHTKNQFHTSNHYWDIGLSGIQQSNQSRASWVIKSRSRILEDIQLRMRSQVYKKNLLSECFKENIMPKFAENYQIPYFGTFWPKSK